MRSNWCGRAHRILSERDEKIPGDLWIKKLQSYISSVNYGCKCFTNSDRENFCSYANYFTTVL
jgi:hypothetical protein